MLNLVESDLGGSLHVGGILVERTVGVVALLLNGGTVLHQSLGHRLVGGLEHVDQGASEMLLSIAEERNGAASCSSTTGTEIVSYL